MVGFGSNGKSKHGLPEHQLSHFVELNRRRVFHNGESAAGSALRLDRSLAAVVAFSSDGKYNNLQDMRRLPKAAKVVEHRLNYGLDCGLTF